MDRRLTALFLPGLWVAAPALSQETQPIPTWTAPREWTAPANDEARPSRRARGRIPEGALALPSAALPFVAISPCRLADTRVGTFPPGYGPPALSAGVPRNFVFADRCGIPRSAQAVSTNLTVTNTLGPGFIVTYPAGGAAPNPPVSSVNYVTTQTVANAAVVPLGDGGAATFIAGVSSTDLVIDVNGYYTPQAVVNTLNALSGPVTLAAGRNVTITPSGQTLTIASAGGDGLTLPYEGTFNYGGPHLFSLTNSGAASAIHGQSAGLVAIWGDTGSHMFTGSANGGVGVAGSSSAGIGVTGYSSTGIGVAGHGSPAIYGYGVPGVQGVAGNGSPSTDAVFGDASYDFNGHATGVHGKSVSGNGVLGESQSGYGVHGSSSTGDGLFGEASADAKSGVFAVNDNTAGYAGYLRGNVHVTGNLSAGGTKPFRIDHPLDPENRELWHAAVESSDVLDLYSGNVVTDGDGLAVVPLPRWFEALNTDFRYQLTVIGRFAQAIVEEEIEHGRFTVRTDVGNVKVSWQVTARRNDAWMRAHPFAAERNKPAAERGTYLAPLEHGQPAEKDVEWVRHPDLMQRLKERQAAGGSDGPVP